MANCSGHLGLEDANRPDRPKWRTFVLSSWDIWAAEGHEGRCEAGRFSRREKKTSAAFRTSGTKGREPDTDRTNRKPICPIRSRHCVTVRQRDEEGLDFGRIGRNRILSHEALGHPGQKDAVAVKIWQA
ncbi:hypothetical protein KI387_023850, partial [Taxus chinensis]